MELYHFIVNFFQEGGFFLYPTAAIFVVGVAIIIAVGADLIRERARTKR